MSRKTNSKVNLFTIASAIALLSALSVARHIPHEENDNSGNAGNAIQISQQIEVEPDGRERS